MGTFKYTREHFEGACEEKTGLTLDEWVDIWLERQRKDYIAGTFSTKVYLTAAERQRWVEYYGLLEDDDFEPVWIGMERANTFRMAAKQDFVYTTPCVTGRVPQRLMFWRLNPEKYNL